MSYYIEPYILFLFSLFFFHANFTGTLSILFIFAALIIISLQIICKNKVTRTILFLCPLVLGIFFPAFVYLLPAITYSVFYQKKYGYASIFLIPYIIKIADVFVLNDLLWLILTFLSFYFAYNTALRNSYLGQIKKLRDNAVEHEIELTNQNRHLLQSQNDQIYIATLQERNRIAREIHDNVGHMLSSSILQVGALLAICKDENCKPILSSLKDTLNSAMTSIRNSVHDLHDESVDLTNAITQICDEFSFCELSLKCEIGKDIPKSVKYSFISITKEALNNVIKHSNATKVTVLLHEHPGFYQLLIEDNGTNAQNKTISFDNFTGIGLSNINERVHTLNGNLHITTDVGFRIFISVPKNMTQ